MNRPLLICDCDEVLLHMVVPFRDWLGEVHHIDFDLHNSDWAEALRHKHDGTRVERDAIWALLSGFFETEMHRQQPIKGSIAAINRIAKIADVVILTNLMDHHNEARTAQLRAAGIDVPVYTNQGGKGQALANIVERYAPSATVFVDDLEHQHDSVADVTPDVWRLQFVGEAILSQRIKPAPSAHARIDQWDQAEAWITGKLLCGTPAPMIDKPSAQKPVIEKEDA
jgi:hypothetical protein